MRITWVTRSFLDYRIPVYRELDRLCGSNLTLIYYRDVVPERVQRKIKDVLGSRAIGLTGEWRIGGRKSNPVATLKRKGVRVPYQPGLLTELRKSRPDVMISDGFFQWTYAPLLMRAWQGAAHVMCYEPTPHTERKAQWFRTAYRKWVARWIDAVCCNGSLCRDYTLSLGIPKEKIILGNMAADSEGLVLAQDSIAPARVDEFKRKYQVSGLLFLYVGRLVELKGLMPLLQGWCRAAPEATLLLAGDGPERMKLESYCREQHLDNVCFAGEINYDELPLFYRAADVFIIPTLQDNWSLVVPEAMASGLPVACSIYNGCHPELVRPENGWTFDPLNLDATAAMLRQIIAGRAALKEKGEASRRIVADYTPQHAAAQIYQTCLLTAKELAKR